MAKKEVLVIVNTTNVREVIVGRHYPIKNGLTALMTPGPNNGKPCGKSWKGYNIARHGRQDGIGKFWIYRFLNPSFPNTPQYRIFPPKPRRGNLYLNGQRRVSRAGSQRRRNRDQRSNGCQLKKGARIRRLTRVAENTVMGRSLSSNDSPLTDISDDSSNQKAY